MKILTNQKIRALFYQVLLCALLFALSGAALIGTGVTHAAAYLYCLALLAFVAALYAMYRYFAAQNRMMEAAQSQITAYIAGDQTARIACDEEGELYALFHEVNALVSILNAQAENEARSKAFLKNTIADISHQLKTPLAALNIYNGIMQDEATSFSEMREFTRLTERELERIETLVQNLLKITRLDAGAITIDKAWENVADLMADVQSHFSFRAAQEGKEISVTGDDAISLYCDGGWLTQALDNIVKNALDHTQAGGHIHIEWKRFASVLRLAVQDDGSGIHPEDLHHIFKRFYRSRFSKDTQGLGLGLPLAKAIIEANGGVISVDSELCRGTSFTIDFLIPTEL